MHTRSKCACFSGHMSQYRWKLLITQHTRSCLDCRVHSPPSAPHSSPPVSCKSVSLALALFPQALYLQEAPAWQARTPCSHPDTACASTNTFAFAQVRPSVHAPESGTNTLAAGVRKGAGQRSRLRQEREEAQRGTGCTGCLHFAVRGARDCLRSVAPAAGHRVKHTPHSASGRSDATLALIRSGRPTKNHLLQVRAFSARCDDQEGTHARARAGAHRATITAQ
jgi:hypothetical protein